MHQIWNSQRPQLSPHERIGKARWGTHATISSKTTSAESSGDSPNPPLPTAGIESDSKLAESSTHVWRYCLFQDPTTICIIFLVDNNPGEVIKTAPGRCGAFERSSLCTAKVKVLGNNLHIPSEHSCVMSLFTSFIVRTSRSTSL